MPDGEVARELARALDADRAAITAGLAHATKDVRALTELVLEEPSRADPRVQGASSALLTFVTTRARLRRALLAAWIAEHGPAFALRAAAIDRSLVVQHPRKPNGGLDLGVRWLAPRTAAQMTPALDADSWALLRAAAAKSKKDRAELERAAEEARAGAPFALRCWIDGVALAPGPAREDVRAYLESEDEDARPFVPALVEALANDPSAASKRTAEELLEHGCCDPAFANRIAPFALDVARHLGERAIEPLMDLLETAQANVGLVDDAAHRRLARALASFEQAHVARFFAARLETKNVGPIAVEYMQRHPELAAGAGARLEKAAQKATKAPKRSRVKRPESPGAREAKPDEIPAVLLDPPWRRARKAQARPVVRELEPVRWEERVVFRDDEEKNEAAEHEDPALRALADDGAAAITRLEERMREAPGAVLPFAARCVDSPRVALAVALATRIPRLNEDALAWASRFPRAAALGALPAFLGPASREQVAAGKLVDVLVKLGMDDVVREAASAYGADARKAMDELLDVVPLYACPAGPPALPRFVSLGLLPRVALSGGALLPQNATLHMIEMLVFSDPDEPYAGIERVRRACDPRSLDAFLAALVQAWMRHRAPESGDWVLDAAVRMGGTFAVREVVKAIRAWVKGRTSRRRVPDALEALARGGDAALTALADLAQKGQSRMIVEHAKDRMERVARERGLAEDDLADRLVPTLDLEPDATTVLDYGPRAFKVTLDENLAPRIVDASGAVLAKAPPAKKTDDGAKARAAIARMKSLKAGLAGLARTLVFRWERAMIDGRKWRTLGALLEHPIQGRLARALVWGAYVGARLAATFRVAEDGTFASAKDERFEPPPGALFGIPHPIELGADACARWAEVLADYRILPAFPQAVRPVAIPTAEEKDARMVLRFRDVEVRYMALIGRLEGRGWKRSAAEEGIASGHHKRIRGVEAWFEFTVDWNEPPPETIRVGRVHLARFEPIAFSEIAYDLSVFDQRA